MSSLQTKRGEGCIIDSHGDVVSKVRMDKVCVKLPFCPFNNSMKDNVPHSIFPFFSLFSVFIRNIYTAVSFINYPIHSIMDIFPNLKDIFG